MKKLSERIPSLPPSEIISSYILATSCDLKEDFFIINITPSEHKTKNLLLVSHASMLNSSYRFSHLFFILRKL